MNLLERLRRLEALRDRPGTPGEKRAAERAIERLVARMGRDADRAYPRSAAGDADPCILLPNATGAFTFYTFVAGTDCVLSSICAEPEAISGWFTLLHADVIREGDIWAPACVDKRGFGLRAYGATKMQRGDRLRLVVSGGCPRVRLGFGVAERLGA